MTLGDEGQSEPILRREADKLGGSARPNRPMAAPTVAVVITTYNHAHFLAEAIASVLRQTHRVAEVVVVDDGSIDDPSIVAARFPEVRLVRQSNQGLAAARNTGLAAVRSDVVTFLDADDRLLPRAIEHGLACLDGAPEAGMVYGAYRNTDLSWRPLDQGWYRPIGEDAYRDFLTGNIIGMHAAVLYRRTTIEACGGFDAALRRCEDYDMYLRVARDHPVASHPNIIAEYRHHGENMSHDVPAMLATAMAALDKQKAHSAARPELRTAWLEGEKSFRRYFGREAAYGVARSLRSRQYRRALACLAMAARDAPDALIGGFAAGVRRRLRERMDHRSLYAIGRLRHWLGRRPLPLGAVALGDLARTHPISDQFGFDRGLPIDRYYIDRFLDANRDAVAGRVLEIGDETYTRQFGGDRVEVADVLHVTAENPLATFVGDLSVAGTLPPDTFDCIILAQTLHLIYDMAAAVREMHRALKPGGVALVTVPGITPVDRNEWGATWYWSLTKASARRLFEEEFGGSAVRVGAYGNVYAAVTFLHGLAVAEADKEKLDVEDEAFPVIVAVRATKGHA